MNRNRLAIAVFVVLVIAGTQVIDGAIWVGRIADGQYTQWKTTGEWAVVDGDNSRLRVYWDTTTREYILDLEANEKHAATDGAIPDMLIGSCCANQLRIRPRFTN